MNSITLARACFRHSNNGVPGSDKLRRTTSRLSELIALSCHRNSTLQGPASSSASVASSWMVHHTDHYERLLLDTVVHRLVPPTHAYNAAYTYQYVLAPAGVDRQTVQKLPHVQLARIYYIDNDLIDLDAPLDPLREVDRDNHMPICGTMFGAKVIQQQQQTQQLDNPMHACSKLVDTILQEHGKNYSCSGPAVYALSTLHGLSHWVLQGLHDLLSTTKQSRISTVHRDNNHSATAVLRDLTEPELRMVLTIARGTPIDHHHHHHRNHDELNRQHHGCAVWERLAMAFVQERGGDGALSSSICDEVSLYQSKGAYLVGIRHNADTSEGAYTCGGSMALFAFE